MLSTSSRSQILRLGCSSVSTNLTSTMINLIWWKFDPYSSYEFDWLNFLLSDFKVNHIVDFKNEVCVDNAIIVANLSQLFFDSETHQKYREELQQFYNYVKRFKSAGMRVGLFHLGDEFYRESTEFYKDLDFVFRQYYKEEDHKRYAHCHYFPIGYKSGFRQHLVERSIAAREHRWSFAGHLKGSRFEMIKHARAIAGGKFHTTSQWNDPNALTTETYAQLLSNTQFSLCPMGNYSVDCFRVYESLEAGAIPIVEAKGKRQVLSALIDPRLITKYGTRDRRFWLRNYCYWENAFAAQFPCPLIYNWADLEAVMQSVDIEQVSEVIQLWWKNYKQYLIRSVQLIVSETFSLESVEPIL
jgi:hypothetical protein